MIWKFDNFPLKLAFCGCYCRVYVGYTGAGNFCSVIKINNVEARTEIRFKIDH